VGLGPFRQGLDFDRKDRDAAQRGAA